MTVAGWAEILGYAVLLTAIVPVIGAYMACVFAGEVTLLAGVERPAYRLLGVDPARGQDWKGYARSVLALSAVGLVVLFAILRTQGMPWDVALNTSASFVTNTNWQYYAGETTLSGFAQAIGLAVQNFVSAAVGIAVVVALIRGLAARSGTSLGSFYVDLIRCLLYVLLPLSVAVGLVFAGLGVPQSFPDLPVASQESIKLLGTNGGGFFNVNSAMPFENPSWISNLVAMLAILAIPAGLTATYGVMVGNRRQGWAVYGAMLAVFLVAVAVVYAAETGPTPAMDAAGITGANLEGKEVRFGPASSALFSVITTAASCGAVNTAMESLSGIGGAVPMGLMMTGENIFGGVGSGLYGMLIFVLLAVFISGLMVGRTPEFLGKRIEAREIKLTVLGAIGVPLLVLATTALAIATDHGRASIFNSGPQGFSETLYAYTSQGNNNGSAFAGYSTTTFADLLGGGAMLLGRFGPLLVALALAGALAGKRVAPPGPGTLRTDTPTFVVVLVAVLAIVALLTFVPALLLGPVAQGMTGELF